MSNSFNSRGIVPYGATPDNVTKTASSRTEYSDGKRTAVFAFGGIYNVNYLQISAAPGAKAELFAFDGTEYQKIADGKEMDGRFTVSFPPQTCYQIKVVSDLPLPGGEARITKI